MKTKTGTTNVLMEKKRCATTKVLVQMTNTITTVMGKHGVAALITRSTGLKI
jgi:hypothetical protein